MDRIINIFQRLFLLAIWVVSLAIIGFGISRVYLAGLPNKKLGETWRYPDMATEDATIIIAMIIGGIILGVVGHNVINWIFGK